MKTEKQIRVYETCKKWRKVNQASLMYSRAKSRAIKKGIEFTIEKSDVVIPEVCPLLGVLFTNTYLNPDDDYNHVPSLDRIDNSKGYIPGNIWVIAFQANRIKNTSSIQEMTIFCKNWLKLYEDI
jgi:hypothetical protein